MSSPGVVARPLIDRIRSMVAVADSPVFVALDGRSGAGKSTLAHLVQRILGEEGVGACVIEGDTFYGGGSAATWDSRSAEDKVANAVDWRRQLDVLADLRREGDATWFSFGWDAPDWDADPPPLETTPLQAKAEPVVLLEGAYTARPELHEHLDLLVLLDTPEPRRRQQLLDREGDEYRADWEGRWSAAEDLYFTELMPPERFDLVIA